MGGGTACQADTEAFGCLRFIERAPIADGIGVNTHYGDPRDPLDPAALAQLRAAGVHFVRNDLDWASVERTPGVYDFVTPGFDALVEAADREGLHILLILDYGNPVYGPHQAVVGDEARQAFASYSGAAAARYGGRGHRWEIWNEPNMPQFWDASGQGPDAEEYALLVEATIPALRAADPSGEILVGSTFMGLPAVVEAIGGIAGLEFLRRLFAAGVPALADGITVHLYRVEPPESAAADLRAVRELMAESGVDLPL